MKTHCFFLRFLGFAIVAALLLSVAAPARAQQNILTPAQKAAAEKSRRAKAVADKTYIPIQTGPEDLTLVAVGTVKEVLRPDLIRLDDGNSYNLLNIRVPLIFAPVVQDYMTKTFVGKKVGIYQRQFPGVSRADKLSNVSGNALTIENVWIEADLVLHGFAYADSSPENRDLVQKLYQFESIARDKREGLWASPDLNLKNAKTILDNSYNSFQVVEDVIKRVKTYIVGQQTYFYFDFGDDASKDFTFIMPSSIALTFDTMGDSAYSVAKWGNRRVRVRGWIENNSGPMIQIVNPEQIEVIGADGQYSPTALPPKDGASK